MHKYILTYSNACDGGMTEERERRPGPNDRGLIMRTEDPLFYSRLRESKEQEERIKREERESREWQQRQNRLREEEEQREIYLKQRRMMIGEGDAGNGDRNLNTQKYSNLERHTVEPKKILNEAHAYTCTTCNALYKSLDEVVSHKQGHIQNAFWDSVARVNRAVEANEPSWDHSEESERARAQLRKWQEKEKVHLQQQLSRNTRR